MQQRRMQQRKMRLRPQLRRIRPRQPLILK
jgi:hypothetical protein